MVARHHPPPDAFAPPAGANHHQLDPPLLWAPTPIFLLILLFSSYSIFCLRFLWVWDAVMLFSIGVVELLQNFSHLYQFRPPAGFLCEPILPFL